MARTPADSTRRAILAFVRRGIAAGASPTVREVQEHCGFRAVESARQHLEALVAAGLLAKAPGRARGYRLPPTVGPVRLVPRLGRIQAGALSEAIEDPDGWIPVSVRNDGAMGEHELFALVVRGESMTGAGILPDDLVIVRRQDTARDGEIVVALVQDEATVKRLRLHAGRIELQPENAAFAPIVLEPGAEVRILGRVVEVRRRLA
ncbi:MAG: repressor LexA [Krumholzibacteria bacterium]|nr:repressor LexA [Candidatus Krumholzibacteria bacterium]